MRLIVEWVQAGILGEVREVHCWTDRPISPWFKRMESIPPIPERVPQNLDWDLWQGPTFEREYSSDYLPKLWRGWWDYGVGSLGDIGCHCLDAPFWALDLGQGKYEQISGHTKEASVAQGKRRSHRGTLYRHQGWPVPGSNFDYASRLTEVVLLGGLAIRTGKRIEYDAEAMRITNHPELNNLIKEPVRDGWSYGEDLW